MKMFISPVKDFSSLPAIPIEKHELTVVSGRLKEPDCVRRRRALSRVDRELDKGNYKSALALVKKLKDKPDGLLRGFGAAEKVHKSSSSSAELKLSGDEKNLSLQLSVDSILHSINCSRQFQLMEEETGEEVLSRDYGNESNSSVNEDHLFCMQHEAGHFLIGYMLGVLPKRYVVPTVEDLLRDEFARGSVEFIGFEFLRDINTAKKNFSRGKLSNESLENFSCVILGGLAAEHILFGYSELLHSDVHQLKKEKA